MNIPKYTLKEKKQVFDGLHRTVESIDDFKNWVKDQECVHEKRPDDLARADMSNNAEPFFVYRGLNDASFKNYTSVQRWLFTNDYGETDFTRLIGNEINALRKDENYCNYLTAHQLGFDEWHALSFLQHYGGYTPCLDFTKDFNMALFFATYKASPANENPLSRYVSIYYMNYPCEFDIYEMHSNSAQNADKLVADYQGPYQIDYSEIRNKLTTMPFNNLFSTFKDEQRPYMAIDNDVWIMDAPHIGINEQHAITNNNIVNQNGCFAVNFSTKQPYEHGKLWCVDINKDLIPEIKTILKSKGIDESAVYSADGYREIVCTIMDKAKEAIMNDKS